MTAPTREKLPRTIAFFFAVGVWVFLAFSAWSFSATDWPSHAVEPYPPMQNLCGSAGAFVSYWAFVSIGQGVFPVLGFVGILLGMSLANAKLGDLWMRGVGLLLISVGFAAAVHHFTPGSRTGLPEGRGGVLGIETAEFLHQYFSTAGTLLILCLTMLVGVLLAADDLLLAAPRALVTALTTIRSQSGAPAI